MSEEKKFCASSYHIYSPEDLTKKWFIYYYLEGKRIRVYGDINKRKTRNARLRAANLLITDLKERKIGGGLTIRERLYEWLEDGKHIWKPRTYETYKSKISSLFTEIGPYVDQEKVDGFMRKIRRELHTTTYNTYVVMIKNAFKEIGEGELVQNLQTVRTTKTPARYFLPDHVDRIKTYLLHHDPELWFFVQFIYYCFIRPNELRQLKVGDVLLDEKKIFVNSKISKNLKSQYVAIPEAFTPALEILRERSPKAYIFPGTTTEKPLGRNTMCNRHRKMLRELGFTDEFKLYSWKHTGAISAVKAGIGVKALQMQLRHHSLDQVNEYLRQMGVWDMDSLREDFPGI